MLIMTIIRGRYGFPMQVQTAPSQKFIPFEV